MRFSLFFFLFFSSFALAQVCGPVNVSSFSDDLFTALASFNGGCTSVSINMDSELVSCSNILEGNSRRITLIQSFPLVRPFTSFKFRGFSSITLQSVRLSGDSTSVSVGALIQIGPGIEVIINNSTIKSYTGDGALYMDGEGSLSLIDTRFSLNTGGTTISSSSYVYSLRCIFDSNSAGKSASVIFTQFLVLDSCSFLLNKFPTLDPQSLGLTNGPIYSIHNITNCTYTFNSGNLLAGYNSVINVIGSRFDYNSEGAIAMVASGTQLSIRKSYSRSSGPINARDSRVELDEIYFSQSYTGPNGGAIYSFSSLFRVSNCTFDGCRATNGGAIFMERSSELVLRDSILKSNRATQLGGAIRAIITNVFQKFELYNVTFALNTAAEGGSIYFETTYEMIDKKRFAQSSAFSMEKVSITSSTSALNGGGMVIFASYLNMKDVTIQDCFSYYGGGMYLGNPTHYDGNDFMNFNASGLRMSRNVAKIYGGSIYLWRSVGSFIENSTISLSSAVAGGGIYLDSSPNPNSYKSSFLISSGLELISCVAEVKGGGIHLDGTLRTVELDGIESYNCSASIRGGTISSSATIDSLIIRNSRATNNSALLFGGFFHSGGNEKDVYFIGNRIDSNSAEYGAALYIESKGNLSIYDSIFINNNVGNKGGAVFVRERNKESNLIIENTEMGYNSAYVGGSLHIEGEFSEIKMNNLEIYGNTASQGGAINMEKLDVDNLSIRSSRFSDNFADLFSGGGIYISGRINQTELKDSTFDDNIAEYNGGSISFLLNSDYVFISNCSLNENAAKSGEGGGFYVQGSVGNRFIVSHSVMKGNTATNGGAMYITGFNETIKRDELSTSVSVSNSLFSSNKASLEGGGIFLESLVNTIQGNQFDGNDAGTQGRDLMAKKGTISLQGNSISNGSLFLNDGVKAMVTDTEDLSFISCSVGKGPTKGSDGQVDCQNNTLSTSNGQNVVVINNTSSVGFPVIIGASVGGGVLLIIIIIVIVMLVLRLRRQRVLRKRNNFSMIDFSTINLGDAKSSVLNFDELQNLKEIGSGAFGIVFKANWRELSVAVKQIKSDDVTVNQLNGFLREVAILKGLRSHPNVVLFLGITFPPHPLSLVTEFCEMGGLYEYLRKNTVNHEKKMDFITGIARGMLHLHLEGVIHRDLAVRNILLSKFLEPKVSDFGLSRESQSVESGAVTATTVGPLKWMAPEAITQRKYSSKSDAWSFGVVVWEIINQEDPFPNMTSVEAAIEITTKGLRLPISSSAPPLLAKLMQGCWSQKPEDRPDFTQICNFLDSPSDKLDERSAPGKDMGHSNYEALRSYGTVDVHYQSLK